MQGYPRGQIVGSLALAFVSTALFACSPRPDSPRRTPPSAGSASTLADLSAFPGSQPPVQGDQIISTIIDARPAALVNGRIVQWGELRPILNEAAGAEALREVILDRMLARALAEAAITITPDDVDAERKLFYTTMNHDPDVAVRLAQELRARQGLGRQRFARLLRRNASLRALVSDRVQVTDEAVQRLYEITHGPKRQARLMVLPSLADAQSAIDRIRAGEFFGDVAVELSTDSSAPRGGLLEPISRADPGYPQAMRQALWSLAPGELSPPVLLGDSYAVLMLVRTVESDGVELQEVRPELRRLVRLNQQRLLMDQLARRLLSEATVTVIDEALKDSWDARRHQRGAASSP